MGQDVAICAIFKNEAPFILEWIAYHKVLGVSSFYLFDNESDDGARDRIVRSKAADSVRVIFWPFRPGQMRAYQYFADNFARHHQWVAFIDIDEFLHPLEHATLPSLLEEYRDHAAVLVNWLNFGSSGHQNRPEGLVILNYDHRLPDATPTHRHVKSIVRAKSLIGPNGVHVMRINGSACNALGQTVPNEAIQDAPCHQRLVINHYYTKSRQDWQGKVSRGRATTEDPEVQKKMEWFEQQYERVAQVQDARIARFAPQVRRLLGEPADCQPPLHRERA